MKQNGKEKRGTKSRRALVSHSLALLGCTTRIAAATGVTDARVRNWRFEGRINRACIPDLIVLTRKRKLDVSQIPWLKLVKPRARLTIWSANRKRIEQLFIILGGQSLIGSSLNVSRMCVKHWGLYASIPNDHATGFLSLCQSRFKEYTGRKLLVDNINIKILHEHFKLAGLFETKLTLKTHNEVIK